MVCMYYTYCCNTPFIGVVENDGMISGGDGVDVVVVVVGGMRREISRTKKSEDETFLGRRILRLTTYRPDAIA